MRTLARAHTQRIPCRELSLFITDHAESKFDSKNAPYYTQAPIA